MGELTLEEAAAQYRQAKVERDAAHNAEVAAIVAIDDARRRKDSAVVALNDAREALGRVAERGE